MSSELPNEELPAIEYIEGKKARHRGETSGGTVTVYRLRLLTPEQIEAHGLQKYTEEGEGNAE